MPSEELVTRGALARRLAVNAATKPLDVAVLGVLVVVGIVLDLVVVVGAIAIVAYLVLVALTFFDADEAERVGNELRGGGRAASTAPALDVGTLEPRIGTTRAAGARDGRGDPRGHRAGRSPLRRRRHRRRRPRRRDGHLGAARAAHLHHARPARRAPGRTSPAWSGRSRTCAGAPATPTCARSLPTSRPSATRPRALEDRLERFDVGMRRICASLGLLRTRLVEMSASEEEAAQRRLARQSRELRERTDLLAEAMAEVFADDDDQQVELPVAEHRPDA